MLDEPYKPGNPTYDRLYKVLENFPSEWMRRFDPCEDIFCIAHNDFSSNNIMYKLDQVNTFPIIIKFTYPFIALSFKGRIFYQMCTKPGQAFIFFPPFHIFSPFRLGRLGCVNLLGALFYRYSLVTER